LPDDRWLVAAPRSAAFAAPAPSPRRGERTCRDPCPEFPELELGLSLVRLGYVRACRSPV